MSQEIAIAEQLHNKARDFFHRFHDMTLDGVVTEEEQDESLDSLDSIQELAELVNGCQLASITLMRRGPEGRRFKMQISHLEASFEDPQNAA